MNDNNDLNAKIHAILSRQQELPYWVVLIQELVDGVGYSYSRIAQRIGVSPSTIQKLATNHQRKPRHMVFHRLLVLYYKVFYGPCRSPQAELYMQYKERLLKEQQTLGLKNHPKV